MDRAVLDWIASVAGSPVRTTRRLRGATTAEVRAVRLENGERCVLRRYTLAAFLVAEPEAPVREVDALRFATAAGLPVPTVLASASLDVPTILMSFVPGAPDPAPDVMLLAELAARIHDVDASAFPHEYFPWYREVFVAPPSAARDPELWREAIAYWHAAMPDLAPTLVHRDFHPGNVLWSRGRITGAVDWVNACRGPWACDVAHCRDNLDFAPGFLEAYLALTGRDYNSYWDLAAILEHDPRDFTAADIVRAEAVLHRVL